MVLMIVINLISDFIFKGDSLSIAIELLLCSFFWELYFLLM